MTDLIPVQRRALPAVARMPRAGRYRADPPRPAPAVRARSSYERLMAEILRNHPDATRDEVALMLLELGGIEEPSP